jgi:hypothetical protein
MKRTAIWLNIAVGVLLIGMGLFNLLAPHFFAIDGGLGNNSKTFLDFAGGVTFLCVGLVFYFAFHTDKTKAHDLKLPRT